MADKDGPNRMFFANRIKPILPEMKSALGEFGTYLLENVAACKQSGGSDLFSKEEAIEIMDYVQNLANQKGGRDTDGTPFNIKEALPELLELLGIVRTIKAAMQDELKVDKELIKRYFKLSARAVNYIQFTVDDTGV